MTTLIEVASSIAINPEMAKAGANLINILLGEPCKVAGTLISDQLYFWQWKNRLRIAAKAKKLLEKENVAGKLLPTGFLIPLLESSGNIEDDLLQNLWAQLLASGVKDQNNCHPAYIQVLEQLSPVEAQMLLQLKESGSWSFRRTWGGKSEPIDGLSPIYEEFYSCIEPSSLHSHFSSFVTDTSLVVGNLVHLQQLGLIDTSTFHPSRSNDLGIKLNLWGTQFLDAIASDLEEV